VTSARRLAVDLLVRIDDGAHTHVLLPAALGASDLDARDRAFVTDLVAGTVRLRGAIDYLIGRVADRGVEDLDARVRAGLRLGTHQLLHATPAHAAVGATVEAVGGRGRGYVNAVLRGIAALGPSWPWPLGDDAASVAVRTSHPEWLVELLMRDFDTVDAIGMLEADNDPPHLTLRPNAARAGSTELRDELTDAGASATPGRLVRDAVVVRGAGDPARIPAVRDGRATPQDEASQAVATLVGARPGERVLDVGAAPGGKATALAERGAHVTALDVDTGRLRLVAEAFERLGVPGALVAADGRFLPMRSASFDRVLVDAPCSGLGVLRRRADARWNLRPEAITELAELQRALLSAAAEVVRPGGVLVYSVCTLSGAETVEVDTWAAETLSGFESDGVPGPPWTNAGRGARLLPQTRGTDGMYVLVLRRSGGTPAGTVAR